MSIIVVGSSAFDDIETPKGKRVRILGGSCIYFSLAASFKAQSKIVSVVGQDFPKNIFLKLNKKKIQTEGLVIEKGKTFSWGGVYKTISEDPETRFTNLNVFQDFQPEIPSSYKKNNKILFLANIDPDLQNKILDDSSTNKFIGLDTMNFWISSKRRSLFKAIQRVDLLTINELELKLITNKDSLEKAFSDIFKKFKIKYLIVKRGSAGSMLVSRRSFHWIPSYPFVNLVDPTGAGDSFAGALFSHLSKRSFITEKDIIDGMIYGSAMSSFTIESFGTERLFKLSLKELESRHKKLRRIARI